MNQYSVFPLVSALLFLLFGIIVLLKSKEEPAVRTAFLLNCLATFWWQFSWFILFNVKSSAAASILVKVGYSGIIFLPVTFFHFYISFLNKNRKWVNICYFIGFAFLIILWASNAYINYYYSYFWGYYPKAGFLHPVYLAYLTAIVIYCLYILFLAGKKLGWKGARANQIKYLFIAFFIYCLASSDFLVNYGIEFYPLGFIFILISFGLVAYAIVKYRLMDINIALTRAGIFVIVYTLVLGIPFVVAGWGKPILVNLFGNNWFWFPLAVFFVFATAGPFIYLFLQRRAEKILRKKQLTYQEKLRVTSSTMMLTKDLDKLLRAIVLNVVDIVNVEWAGIYLGDEKEAKFILKHHRSKMGEIDLPKEFAFDSELVKSFYNTKLPLIGEEIHSLELKIGLAVPCFLDSNMIGFLLLGDKPKGQIYDQSDVNEFTLLSNQTALAIENCQFYVREKQSEHSRKISSLDIQSASMAHEIDNPNQAILRCMEGAEMILEELEGVIPKEKMEQLKYKLSRGKYNSTRISKMLEAVREYCQVSTGEFKATSLKDLMESYHEVVKPQLKYNGVDFKYELPQEPIWLRANKIELEEVLVNLTTNSVQAILEMPKDRKKEINLKAYRTGADQNTLRIDLSDTGSGIEAKLIEDIFLDFVTTKASSVSTGLGLSISRKIIERHKGKIWAESEGKNKGAAFHIELPIPTDITEEEIKQAEELRIDKERRLMI